MLAKILHEWGKVNMNNILKVKLNHLHRYLDWTEMAFQVKYSKSYYPQAEQV